MNCIGLMKLISRRPSLVAPAAAAAVRSNRLCQRTLVDENPGKNKYEIKTGTRLDKIISTKSLNKATNQVILG